ncbi:transposase [Bacillus cereus]
MNFCINMGYTESYVYTHGKGEVTFVFFHLLGCQMMPRFKAVHA